MTCKDFKKRCTERMVLTDWFVLCFMCVMTLPSGAVFLFNLNEDVLDATQRFIGDMSIYTLGHVGLYYHPRWMSVFVFVPAAVRWTLFLSNGQYNDIVLMNIFIYGGTILGYTASIFVAMQTLHSHLQSSRIVPNDSDILNCCT